MMSRVVGLVALVAFAGCARADDAEPTEPSLGIETVESASPAPSSTSSPPPSEPSRAPDTPAPETQVAETQAPDTQASPIPDRPLPLPTIEFVEVGRAERPVEATARPGDDRVFVVEQAGRVIVLSAAGSEVVLDISDRVATGGSEQGLLGLAFHPDADLAYLHYSDLDGDTVLAEFTVDPSSAMFDPGSSRVLLTVDQPFGNHNGGELLFGPDDLLYLGLGDGGSADDPLRSALDLSSPLGKILRIDPRPAGGSAVTIPADNPFVGDPDVLDAIWAFGLRNPWKFSFDAVTGDLWIADVGQNEVEEINRAPSDGGVSAGRGVNFGWSAFEGNERFNDDQPSDGTVAPVLTYPHAGGNCSVSGGAVARGEQARDLTGWYVYGDYCTGTVWGYDSTSPAGEPVIVELGMVPDLAAIAEGSGGDLFAVSRSGPVFRLVPA